MRTILFELPYIPVPHHCPWDQIGWIGQAVWADYLSSWKLGSLTERRLIYECQRHRYLNLNVNLYRDNGWYLNLVLRLVIPIVIHLRYLPKLYGCIFAFHWAFEWLKTCLAYRGIFVTHKTVCECAKKFRWPMPRLSVVANSGSAINDTWMNA